MEVFLFFSTHTRSCHSLNVEYCSKTFQLNNISNIHCQLLPITSQLPSTNFLLDGSKLV